MMPLQDLDIIKGFHLFQNKIFVFITFNVKCDSVRETDDTLHFVCFVYLLNRVILGNSYIIFCNITPTENNETSIKEDKYKNYLGLYIENIF